ncbi:hypothetical protein C8R45DRAFT_1100421 [Mycena sanguinolenta]|nr:hypothetical protein C8R45DRAFT_1100421 [Mycena sanguinolenta]
MHLACAPDSTTHPCARSRLPVRLLRARSSCALADTLRHSANASKSSIMGRWTTRRQVHLSLPVIGFRLDYWAGCSRATEEIRAAGDVRDGDVPFAWRGASAHQPDSRLHPVTRSRFPVRLESVGVHTTQHTTNRTRSASAHQGPTPYRAPGGVHTAAASARLEVENEDIPYGTAVCLAPVRLERALAFVLAAVGVHAAE